MIKAYIEQAIKSIEAERERKIAVVRENIKREKIVPYNAEIDSARTKALTEVDNEYNAKLVALKQEYEGKKQQLITLGEERKKANEASVLASELAVYTIEYDSAIAKLNAQLADIKD